MALPTNDDLAPEVVLGRVRAEATSVLRTARAIRNSLPTPVPVTSLLDLHHRLRTVRAFGTSILGLAGLADLAKVQMRDPDYNLDAAFLAAVAAGQAVTSWIEANVPGDGAGGVVTMRFVPNGAPESVSMEAVGLAGALDDLITSVAG